MRLAVVGGGVAGLAGARAALVAARDAGMPLRITLIESAERFGGKVWTETGGETPIDWGPDSFLAAKPWARELAEELGLGGELVAPGPAARRAYLLLGGRLRPLPPGLAMGIPAGAPALLGAVREGIIGPASALRSLLEPLMPGERREDPTVAEVCRRRLGRRVADRLVAPLVSGVFGVAPEELSFRTALPMLAGARSLVLAMARAPRSGGPIFLTLRPGLGALVDALVAALEGEDLRLECAAEGLARDGDGWRVATTSGEVRADALLIAAPAFAAARLLEGAAPECARALAGIRYRPSVVLHLQYDAGALARPLDGSGYLVAGEEGGVVSACSWVGTKWPHLATDSPRIRAIATSPEAFGLSDDVLRERAAGEVSRVMRARRGAEEVRLVRWPEAMPVYAPGHAARVAAAERALPAGVALAGAAYAGVGVPDCVRTGQEAARRLVARFALTPRFRTRGEGP